MNNTFESIDIAHLAGVTGGRSIWDRAKDLGKAAVNGGVNVINQKLNPNGGPFMSDKGPIEKPFKGDPLSQALRP